MQTYDGLHLDVTTYGPDDAPLTVFLAHCGTLDHRSRACWPIRLVRPHL